MSVNNSLTGNVWCSQFKSGFNNIELGAGDRDTGGHNDTVFQETNDFDQYVAGCPHAVNSPITCGLVSGDCYGKEYYFDYPYPNSLARFIFVSPKIYNITGVCTTQGAGTLCSSQTGQPCTDQYGCWQYHPNDIHYNWAAQAIDDARAEGIKWIIVVMHKNCITAGVNTCSMGIDFFNMLVSKKVDLIVQAHEESYQRSKQVALNNNTCTKFVANINGWVPYDSSCIVNDGSSNYVPGKGTVIVIQGNWGRGWDPVNSTSVSSGQNAAEAPYFATLMGQNTVGRGHGFVTYKVSPDRIDVQTEFAGTYQDSFSISNSSYRSHSSISITNNAEFTSANGVTQGDGSPSNPYLIRGWEIESGITGIDVRSTTVYFVIRDVFVLGLNNGISFLNVVNGAVRTSSLSDNYNGIVVSNSSFSLIDNNTIIGGQEGILFNHNSNHDACTNNAVSGSSGQGITISQESANITVSGNVLRSNYRALSVVNATSTSVVHNHMVSSVLGMYVQNADNTTIFENTLASNLDGIVTNQSQTIRVFHNNFVSNTQSPPVQVNLSASTTRWDDGYPSGGNFWSDYSGADNCSGSGQNTCTGPDSIGDRPYLIDSLDQDSYPLVKPYGPEPSSAPVWPSSSLLVAINIDRDSLTLTWSPATDIDGVTGYRVYESTVLIARLSGTVLPLTGLKLGATYTFKVEAVDAWSNATVNGPQLTVRVLAQGGVLGIGSLSVGASYQGSLSRVVANLTNLGQEDTRVTSLIVTGDVGTFSVPGVPANVLGGASRVFSLNVGIPGDAYPGNHTVTMTVNWQYYESGTGNWIDAFPLSVSGWLVVKSSGLPPSHSPSNSRDQAILRSLLLLLSNPYELAGLGGFLTMLIAAAIFRRNRRKHDSLDTAKDRTQ
jgi:parallel beta-helix repeat protein